MVFLAQNPVEELPLVAVSDSPADDLIPVFPLVSWFRINPFHTIIASLVWLDHHEKIILC